MQSTLLNFWVYSTVLLTLGTSYAADLSNLFLLTKILCPLIKNFPSPPPPTNPLATTIPLYDYMSLVILNVFIIIISF